MFKRLLVAIDRSASADVTISFATAIAQHVGASVHLLHVNEYVVGSRYIPLATDEEATQLVADGVHQLLSEGIRTTASVRRAPYRQVAHRIVSAADEFSADVIILGSRRSRRFGRLFSSQVRERTVRRTSLPVIAAPAPLDFPSPARLDIADILKRGHDRNQTMSGQRGR
jgi:nucleotide-binding universal stress UspA family protein